jgi:hypothetical protein
MRSEPLGPQQRISQVKQQACGNETGERVIEHHGVAPSERFRAKWVPVRVKKTRQNLKPFAGVGVAERRDEEAEAEGQHEDVQHEVLLCAWD